VALLGSQAVPLQRTGIILRYTVATEVHGAKSELRFCMALFCGFAVIAALIGGNATIKYH
jgi:hypothetical protein